ncbi:SRPBCC family protein [Arthrobacter sp. MYb213]|uniref:SRPBCC family protein n=1 Tax=Arthrobacter sp. MYb213 TaxID=1848595 RepID=UPI000CFC63B3|nr:SRPBCC family protein [Arthrobacter sp. MYb213]PRB67635.1 cyclase [Arthrobacter sp. MYb213]
MAVYFECVTQTQMSRTELFDRSRSIDAHLGSMSQTKERAVAGVLSGLISLGEQVTWKARHFGIPFRLTTKITAMDPARMFIDEQLRGPFKSFHHVHEFFDADGMTMMIDRVSFAAPFGPLGWVAERLVLGWYMPQLIRQRNKFLLEN